MRKKIYLDNAASTPIDKKVVIEMAKAAKLYGNPSSYNDCGREARKYLEESRLKIARFLGAHSDEIIFTSSGTEANNLAIQGTARSLQPNSKFKIQNSKFHIVTTRIEHPSVLKPVKWLEKSGFNVTYLSANKEGFVDLEELQKSLRPETILVSVMYANNEIGTIEPINRIAKIISDFRKRKLETLNSKFETNSKSNPAVAGQNSKCLEVRTWNLEFGEKLPVFHVDACQAVGYLDVNVNHLGVDLLTFNGSKIYGPKGIGVLYVRRGVKLSPVLLGGEQESGLRAGTENLPAIGGLTVALDRIKTHSTSSRQGKESKRLVVLRDYFIQKIKILILDVMINGALGRQRLPNNINISMPDLTSETLLLELDKYSICAGSGSACTSHSVEPSHVLKAIGVEKKYLNGALRFSMGRQTTRKDVDYVLKALPKIVKELKRRYRNVR